MTQGKQRKNIYITMDRVALLAKGKDVFLTQDGQPYRMIPQLNCCPEMAQLRKTPAGKHASGFSVCPYCKRDMIPGLVTNGGATLTKRGQWAIGKKRVKGTDGKWMWVHADGKPHKENRTA